MIDSIRPMADEVAGLMAARFGGARRGHPVPLEMMIKRRGGALPRKLRREAMLLAQADRVSGQPKLSRQLDFDRLDHAYRALTAHLRPLGQGARLWSGMLSIAASVVFGLLMLGLIVIWIMRLRGLV